MPTDPSQTVAPTTDTRYTRVARVARWYLRTALRLAGYAWWPL